ncbi:MAG: GMC family oxidoreductase [Actinobacteria bacterium]|nr:GMC family oxidoreductase [Actinomycetota bacterium]
MTQAPLSDETGTVVIGAGTGGAAFAGLLARHSDEPILLLDAGPDYGPFDPARWPGDMLDAKSIPLSHDWGLVSAPPQRLDLPRARIVGGCSAHNGCTISRSARADYDGWAAAGNPGWDAATVEPLLDWAHERFRVRRYRMDELTVAQAAFVNAGVRTGLPFADDLDDLAAGPGIGPMPVNIVDGVRWNAAFAFLDPVRDRPGLRIAARTHVRRILIGNGAATGVEVTGPDGRAATIRARRVVVAAGAYHSPALLQRSGIGAADRLRGLGLDVAADLPGVGAHLLDHACVELDFNGRPGLADELAAQAWNPDEQTVGRARSARCDDGPYDIHVFMVAGANSGHPGLPPISLYGGAMRAISEGQVTIGRADPDANPTVDHRYGTDPGGHDRAVLAEALALLRDLTRDPGLRDLLGTEHRPERDPLAGIVSYCHPAGTCKMGPASDPGAVVGPTGAVHGLDGLYVCDASIMPAITRGNINLPTAMIGARVAAGLLGLDPARAAGLIHQN